MTLVARIRSRDLSEIRKLLGATDDAGLLKLVREGRFDEHEPDITLTARTLADVFWGRQEFLVSGYGGAHRGAIVRGRIEELDYAFISGGFEITR